MSGTTGWFVNFEFDLPTALEDQLTELFASMDQGTLNDTNAGGLPEAQGVYELYLDGELVYVGKTDADAGLRNRLLRHSKKIKGRRNLEAHRVSFKAIRVYVFTAMDLEAMLLDYYKAKGTPPSWNLSGFGANDPGRERDTTKLKPTHFDLLYPVDLELKSDPDEQLGGPGRELAISEVFRYLKDTLPYNIRFQNLGSRSRRPHRDLDGTTMKAPAAEESVLSTLRRARRALGPAWQITVLPGYVIAYEESRHYPHGRPLDP